MLDARVDQEENLAVGKLAAVMEQDALVARSTLDVEAVLLLVVLEFGYDGVDLGHPVGGERIMRSRRRFGSGAVHPLRQHAGDRHAHLLQESLGLAVQVLNQRRQDHLPVGAVSDPQVPAVERAVPRDHVLIADVILHLRRFQGHHELEERIADLLEFGRVALIHPGGGGRFEHQHPVDLLPLGQGQREAREVFRRDVIGLPPRLVIGEGLRMIALCGRRES